MSNQSQKHERLSEFVESRRERDLPTSVHINGTGIHYPEDVRETAGEVADLIAGEDGDVYESGYERIEAGDVALVEVPVGRAEPTQERIDDMRKLASRMRASSYAGLVGYSDDPDVPASILKTSDVSIVISVDGRVVYRVQCDWPHGEYYKVRLNGI